MGIIRSPPNFATVLFPYTHNFLPSAEKIAQCKGNLARPNLDCVKLTAVQEKETNRITENFHLSGRHHQRFIKIHNVIQYIYSKTT